MTPLPLIAVALLAVIPPWIHASQTVVVVSLVGGLLLLAGLFRPSLVAAAAGGGVQLLAYAIAVASAGATPGLLDALAVGVALVLAIDAADFARSLNGAEVSPAVAQTVGRNRAFAALLGTAAVVGLAALVGLVDLGAPPVFRPLLTGLGGLLALAAALTALKRR